MYTSPRSRAHISIGQLPNEILGEVFKHHVALDHSPWCLTFVCRGWQRVALGTPALWTHIVVANPAYRSDQGWFSFGRKKWSAGRASICFEVQDFREAVNRAGILPLHVDVKIDRNYVTAYIIDALLEEAFSSPIAHRTSSLVIDISDIGGGNLGWGLGIRVYSRLESLRVVSIPEEWMPDLLELAYTSSPTSFVSLEIMSQYSLTEEQIEEFSCRFPSLEHLGGRFYLPSNRQNQVATFPFVKELTIACNTTAISQLCLPHLQSLEISLSPSHNSGIEAEASQLEFPLLLKLQFTARATCWLENIVAPRLQSLSIMGIYHFTPKDWQFRPLSRTFPTVKNISFESGAWGYKGDGDTRDDLLIAVFQAVPNATSVVMSTGSSSSSDPKLRLQLLDRLGSTDADDILCPQLQDLELTSLTRRSSKLADYEIYLLERIVDARKQMGRSLKRFVIAWKMPDLEQLLTRRFV